MSFCIRFSDNGVDLRRRFLGIEDANTGSYSSPFAWAQHGPPVIDRVLFEKQKFELPGGLKIYPAKPSRDDPRIVKHQHISFAEKPHKLREFAVFDLPGISVQDEQSRLIALGRGRLRNQFRRQIVVKVGRSHELTLPVDAWTSQIPSTRKVSRKPPFH